jgi:putative flippase GtrA
VGLLPARFHGITKEFAKFGTIGVINLVVNFAVSNLLLLTLLRGGELKAKAVAAVVATTCAYFMNRHWTYRERPKSTLRREYSLFFFFNLVGLIIEVGTVGFTKYVLHETHIVAFNISTAVGIGLGTLFRFWAYRTHVFKLGTDSEPADVSVQLATTVAEAPSAVHDIAPVSPVPTPRLIVTSVEGGTVVLKVLEPEPLDEIDLDQIALTEEPATSR